MPVCIPQGYILLLLQVGLPFSKALAFMSWTLMICKSWLFMPCNHAAIPFRFLSFCLPLILFPLISPFVTITIFFIPSLLIIFTKSLAYPSLILMQSFLLVSALCNTITIIRDLVHVWYSLHSSKKPHFFCTDWCAFLLQYCWWLYPYFKTVAAAIFE